MDATADSGMMTREEEKASGISPDISESDILLDELIELFDTAATDRLTEDQEKKRKLASDLAKAQEMRQLSVESLGESRKRKSAEGEEEPKSKKKKYGE
eukprot:gene13645-15073_t